MTRAQEIRIGMMKGNGWRRYSWAILPGRLERLPLLFHPFADCKYASVEADGRVHYHCKRTELSDEWERALPKLIGMTVREGEPVYWDGEALVDKRAGVNDRKPMFFVNADKVRSVV